MIDKTIKLAGEYPSDFKPSTSIQEILFNANVLMKDIGKVWHGDLNLTADYSVLKDIAKSLNTTLYVLWESDGRFGEENKPLTALLDKAVWSTDDTKPTKEWYLNKQKTK
jgi:hypothetical protein